MGQPTRTRANLNSMEILELSRYEFKQVLNAVHCVLRADHDEGGNFMTKKQMVTLTDIQDYMITVCDLWERKRLSEKRKEEPYTCRPGLHDSDCGPVRSKLPECRCGCTPSDWCHAQNYLMDQFMEDEMSKGLREKHKVSDEMAAVIGTKKASRLDCMKLIWKYIKKKKLNDGRTINADGNLKALFGGKKSIDMMKLAGIVSQHIIKK